MQSFLQYRKLRKNLQDQIKRHGLDSVTRSMTYLETTVSLQQTENRPKTFRPQRESNPNTQSIALEEKEFELGRPGRQFDDAGSEKFTEESRTPSGILSRSGADARPHEDPQLGPSGPTPIEDSRSTPFHDTVTEKETQPELAAPEDIHDLSGSTTQETASLSSGISHSAFETDLEAATTHETTGTVLGQTLTGINVRSRRTNEGGRERGKVFVVGYHGDDDPMNPHNWPRVRRWAVTLLVASVGLIVGVASSIDSAAIQQAKTTFHVSEVTESLATGNYLIGFGVGAFFAAPISETVGRNPVYIVTMGLFMIFIMASALAPNIGAQLVFRVLAGFFGSTPLTCAGGSISDMWTATERTAVFPVFANAAFWGPVLGPVIGGFIAESSVLSWRWCEWITLIWAGLILVTLVLFMPETYAPVLLKWKAEHLRRITGDERYMSSLEVQDTKFTQRLLHNMYRPFVLFAYEPIVVLFTLYLTVVYIVLFTFLTGFEFIFTKTYGLSQGTTFLIFVTIGIGFGFASALVPWVYKSYIRALHTAQSEGRPGLPPERRLIFAMIGAPFLPIGLFWMAWTTYPSISVWSPIISCIPVGFAIMGIFISTYQYLIDAFESYAASALVGATFVRYVAAGGMIPVSIPFYENLGVHWTLTLLGGISAVMCPVPFVFYKYGAAIRKRSRHAAG